MGLAPPIPPKKMVSSTNNEPRVTYAELYERMANTGNASCYISLLEVVRDLQSSAQLSRAPMMGPTMGQGFVQQTYPGLSIAPAASQMPQAGYPSQLQGQQGLANMATPVPSVGAYVPPALGQVAGQPGQYQTGYSQPPQQETWQQQQQPWQTLPPQAQLWHQQPWQTQPPQPPQAQPWHPQPPPPQILWQQQPPLEHATWKQQPQPWQEQRLERKPLQRWQQPQEPMQEEPQEPIHNMMERLAHLELKIQQQSQLLHEQKRQPFQQQQPADSSLVVPSVTTAPQIPKPLAAEAPVFTPPAVKKEHAPDPKQSMQTPSAVTKDATTPEASQLSYADQVKEKPFQTGEEVRPGPVAKKTGPSKSQESKGYWFQFPETDEDGTPTTTQGEIYHQFAGLFKQVLDNAEAKGRSRSIMREPSFGVLMPQTAKWYNEFYPYLKCLKEHWGAIQFSLKSYSAMKHSKLKKHYILVGLDQNLQRDMPLPLRPGLVRQIWDALLCVLAWREAMVSSGHAIDFKVFADDRAKAIIHNHVPQLIKGLNNFDYVLDTDCETNTLVVSLLHDYRSSLN